MCGLYKIGLDLIRKHFGMLVSFTGMKLSEYIPSVAIDVILLPFLLREKPVTKIVHRVVVRNDCVVGLCNLASICSQYELLV